MVKAGRIFEEHRYSDSALKRKKSLVTPKNEKVSQGMFFFDNPAHKCKTTIFEKHIGSTYMIYAYYSINLNLRSNIHVLHQIQH